MGICSRIAQSRGGKQVEKTSYFSAKPDTSREEDAHLRFLGLSVIESIISSLVTWGAEVLSDVTHHEEEELDLSPISLKEIPANPVIITARNPLGKISMTQVCLLITQGCKHAEPII